MTRSFSLNESISLNMKQQSIDISLDIVVDEKNDIVPQICMISTYCRSCLLCLSFVVTSQMKFSVSAILVVIGLGKSDNDAYGRDRALSLVISLKHVCHYTGIRSCYDRFDLTVEPALIKTTFFYPFKISSKDV